MDEKFVKEQEQKAGEFDMQLAEDTINSLEKKVNELVKFIALQSANCFESECRKKAIREMGQKAYLTYLIQKKEYEAFLEEDWNYIVEQLNKD